MRILGRTKKAMEVARGRKVKQEQLKKAIGLKEAMEQKINKLETKRRAAISIKDGMRIRELEQKAKTGMSIAEFKTLAELRKGKGITLVEHKELGMTKKALEKLNKQIIELIK